MNRNFISDKRRVSYQHAVYTRIYRGQSVLIEGNWGVGKTQLLSTIVPRKLKIISIESLDNIHQILSSVLRQMDYDAPANYRKTSEYLKRVCEIKKEIVIFVDEVQDIDRRAWSYFKRIMDAGIPIVFVGLPKVRTYLKDNHPDILSRLKVLVLYPVLVDDFIIEYADRIEAEAVQQAYVSANGDMRKFEERCNDALDKARETGVGIVTLEMMMDFIY